MALLDPHPDTINGRLISLQQSYGNKAVTSAIQRDKRQSTDAPGKKKPKPKPEAAKEYFWPTQRRYPAEGEGALLERANQDAQSTVKNDLLTAAWRYEDYFLLTKQIAVGKPLSAVYAKIGDEKRSKFWDDVRLKNIKVGEEAPAPGSREHA